jgi:hypothetical protein
LTPRRGTISTQQSRHRGDSGHPVFLSRDPIVDRSLPRCDHWLT